MSDTSLRITEIFHSLQGETSTTGLPTVFVRLTGCPLRCGYCDTAYAFEGGNKLSLTHILGTVADYGAHHVTVTGGEPLAQPQCNRQDYDWCCLKMDELQLAGKVSEILFSPSQGELAPKQLAEWILADRLNVRMQLQTHKFIWGDQPGH